MDEVEVFAILAITLGLWYSFGSWVGRRVMRSYVRSCLEEGGALRLITPSSALVEFKMKGFRYLGIYVEGLPFDNPFNLVAKLASRRSRIAIVKIQPEEPIPGEASITRSNLSRGGEEIRGYRVVYRAISRSRLEYIVDRVASKDIDRLVIGSRPNITIITRAKKWGCSEILKKSIDLVDEISLRKGRDQL